MNDAKPILGEDTIFGRLYYQDADYAALEAENARLVGQLEQARKGFPAMVEYVEEIAQLRAQLAAIQGGMGEAVGFDRNAAYAACPESGCDWGSFYVGWKAAAAQHQRITAAMAAEVERLREERDSFQRVGILATEERDAALDQLEAIRGQEPVLWFRSLIGAQCKPDGRCYDVVFSPCEGFMPLYALPPASPDVEGLVKALEATLKLGRGTSGRIILESEDEEALRTALSTWRQAQEGKP